MRFKICVVENIESCFLIQAHCDSCKLVESIFIFYQYCICEKKKKHFLKVKPEYACVFNGTCLLFISHFSEMISLILNVCVCVCASEPAFLCPQCDSISMQCYPIGFYNATISHPPNDEGTNIKGESCLKHLR